MVGYRNEIGKRAIPSGILSGIPMVGYRNHAFAHWRWKSILSGIPMVGYRNYKTLADATEKHFIRHSDGGVSEQHWLNGVKPSNFIRHSDGGVSELTL